MPEARQLCLTRAYHPDLFYEAHNSAATDPRLHDVLCRSAALSEA